MRSRSKRGRGAAFVEYIVALVFVGIAGIVAWKFLGSKARCKMALALERIGGSAAAACDGEGAPGGSPAPGGSSAPVAQNGPTPGQCFVAGTPVWTADGPRPIESLEAGALVLARDQRGAGELAWKPVVRTFASRSRSLVRLTLGDEPHADTLLVTPNHRVQVLGRGWLAAGELQPGDELVDESEAPLPVAAVEALDEQVPVFNLEVEGFHTYFVGALRAWVHNGGPQAPPVVEEPPVLPVPEVVVVPVRRRPPRRVNLDGDEGAQRNRRRRPPRRVIHFDDPPAQPPPPRPATPEPPRPATPEPPPSRPTAAPTQSPAPPSLADLPLPTPPPGQQSLYGGFDPDKLHEQVMQDRMDKPGSLWEQHGPAWSAPSYHDYRDEPPRRPNEVVGTLTIHARPSSDDPGTLRPADIMNGAVGHSWISFESKPGREPSHLPYTLWNDARQGKPTTLGFFPSGPLQGLGAPGQIMIPDRVPAAGLDSTSAKSYPLTQAQLDNLLLYVDDHKETPYNLCTHNCTTWAAGAVSSTGNTPPPSTWGGISNPNALHNGIQSQAAPGGCG